MSPEDTHTHCVHAERGDGRPGYGRATPGPGEKELDVAVTFYVRRTFSFGVG